MSEHLNTNNEKGRMIGVSGKTPESGTNMSDIWGIHSYINEYIRFADAKAGAVILIATAGAGVNLDNQTVRAIVALPFCEFSFLHWWLFICFGFFFISFCFAVATIFPRLWSSNLPFKHTIGKVVEVVDKNCAWVDIGSPAKSLIFWDDISSRENASVYQSDFERSDLKSEVLDHIYILSRVATNKYYYLHVSAKCGIVSLVGFVIALVFGRYF